jgi:hypothetical protein
MFDFPFRGLFGKFETERTSENRSIKSNPELQSIQIEFIYIFFLSRLKPF